MIAQLLVPFHLAVAIAFASSVGSAPGQITYGLLALTDMPAPDTEPSVVFGAPVGRDRAFTFAAIDHRGEAVICGFLANASKNASQGIWTGTPGSLRLLVRSRQKPPGSDLPELVSFAMPCIDGAGSIAFLGSLAGKSRPVPAIWLVNGGAFRPVAIAGEPPPGASGSNYSEKLSILALNAAGQIMILDDNPKASSIWVGAPGDLRLLARTGDPAPGAGQDVLFKKLNKPRMSATGWVVFSATLQGKGVTEKNDSALWTGLPGTLELLVSEGDAKPSGNGAFGDLARTGSRSGGDLAINNRGQIAFVLGREIWINTPEGLRVIVRDGDRPAGGPKAGRVDLSTTTSLVLYDDGRLMFWDERAAWLWEADGLRPLVRMGDPAPGTDGLAFDRFSEVVQTPGGRLAFIAAVRGTKTHGLWMGRPGTLQCVVREDQEFPLAEGDLRKIIPGSLALSSAPQAGGLSSLPLNDSNQVVFRVAFEPVRGVRNRSDAVLLARLPSQ